MIKTAGTGASGGGPVHAVPALPPLLVTCDQAGCDATWKTRAANRGRSRCPVCRADKHVVRDEDAGGHPMLRSGFYALPVPAGCTPESLSTASESDELLSGVRATSSVSLTWEDEDAALAVLAVRRLNLRHPCASTPDSPGCDHPGHARDMALLRGDLEKLGLPLTAELIPLADEIRKQELGERYRG
jgi:hypothetical protein